jgi:hypothetical protein
MEKPCPGAFLVSLRKGPWASPFLSAKLFGQHYPMLRIGVLDLSFLEFTL